MGGQPPKPWEGDFSGAEQVAQKHAGDSGDPGMFSQALQSVQTHFSGNQAGPINEAEALDAHQQVYGGGGGAGGLAAGSIGTAAAMQSLKSFLGGQSGGMSLFLVMLIMRRSE
jgi:hypothetical protein